jgi:uncharacterized coiled-coil protein SlyX
VISARAAVQPTKSGAPERSKRDAKDDHEAKRRADAAARKIARAQQAHRAKIDDLEARIADREQAIREIEQTMAAPGFYDDRAVAQPLIDRHQALMWEVGDLMHQWEELQSVDLTATSEA